MKRHLHPAAVHLLLGLFSLLCFGVVARAVATGHPITLFDEEQAQRFYKFSSKHSAVKDFAGLITDLGAGRPQTIVIAGVAIILLTERRWRLAIFWALTQWLVRYMVAFAKDAFERPRPPFTNMQSWSFPSGHTTGAMATYAMIAYLIAWRWPDRWFRWPAVFGMFAIILAVGLSRMLLGVHYYTDVLGGYFLGLGYVSLCVAVIEWVRIRDLRRKPNGEEPPRAPRS